MEMMAGEVGVNTKRKCKLKSRLDYILNMFNIRGHFNMDTMAVQNHVQSKTTEIISIDTILRYQTPFLITRSNWSNSNISWSSTLSSSSDWDLNLSSEGKDQFCYKAPHEYK